MARFYYDLSNVILNGSALNLCIISIFSNGSNWIFGIIMQLIIKEKDDINL